MPEGLRQSVLNCKPKVSHDCGEPLGHTVLMTDDKPASVYKAEFIGRVRAAREARFSSQEELCEVLGLKQPTYNKYETRSFMPHQLIPRFCKACSVRLEWIYEAKGPGPSWKPYQPSKTARKGERKRRRLAA